MNLTSSLVANLLTISNLTLFLDFLITDGKYKTVLLDLDDAYLNDYDFVEQMANLAGGKYAIVSRKLGYDPIYEPLPFPSFSDSLRIVKFSFSEVSERERDIVVAGNMINVRAQNIVLLIPDDRKRGFWSAVNEHMGEIPYRNVSVVFYGPEQTEFQPIEVYALNYKFKKAEDNRVKGFEVDEDNSLYNGSLNETDLNERLFGMIWRKSNFVIMTDAPVDEFWTKATMYGRNETKVNLGSSEYFLSNFIAKNLRFKDIFIKQLIAPNQIIFENGSFGIAGDVYYVKVSDENVYTELYNKMLTIHDVNHRFVLI